MSSSRMKVQAAVAVLLVLASLERSGQSGPSPTLTRFTEDGFTDLKTILSFVGARGAETCLNGTIHLPTSELL